MDYSKLKKDELLDEVAKRNAAGRELGVDSSSTKEDIIASLQIDDDDAEANTKSLDDGNLPEGDRNNIPDVALPGAVPKNSDYKGRYKNKNDGETYALVVVEDDPNGNTHKLKNTAHYFEGSEEDFKANFDKV